MSKKKEEKTAVTDNHGTDNLLIHANYVVKMFDTIFTVQHIPEIRQNEKSISIMLYEMALILIQYDKHDNIMCLISIYDECSNLLIAELINMMKDIFGSSLYVHNESYIQDPVDGDLIWGRNNIDDHQERVWGRKLQHTIWFADDCGGHS